MKPTTMMLYAAAFTIGLSSQCLAVGETGAQFLKIGVGGKACAMGEAFVALANDPSAVYWNPAGLNQIDRTELLGMQNFWLLDMSYQYLALTTPTRIGALGIAVAYSSSGTIPKFEDFRQTGEYTAYDAALTAAYANSWKEIDYGIGFKIIQQKIEKESAVGFAADIGLLYPYRKVTFGLAIRNIGPGIKFINQADPLPLDFRIGAAYRVKDLTLSGDLVKPIDNDAHLNIGAEYIVLKALALRGGFNTANSFTLGLGAMWRNVIIDYGFVPFKEIEMTHIISVRVAI